MAQSIKFPIGPSLQGNPDLDVFQIKPDDLAGVRGNTSFGRYDEDPQFRRAAKKFAIYAARRLGWPEMSIEIYEADLYSALEEAMDELGQHVSDQNIEDNLSALLGTDPEDSKQEVWVKSTGQAQAMEIADQYGTSTQSGMGAGGDVQQKRGYFWTEARRQSYHHSEIRTETEVRPGEFEYRPVKGPVVIDRVFYQRNFEGLTGFGFGGVGLGLPGYYGGYTGQQDTLQPLSDTLINIQNQEMALEMFGAQRSFDVVGDKIRIFPIPRKRRTVWLEFKYKEDLLEGGQSSGVVSDYSNAPYDFLRFSAIGASPKRWVFKYAYAAAQHKLGTVRSKFSDVPSPGDSFQLDGDDLKSQAQQKMDELRQQLLERLEKLSKESQMERMANRAESLNRQLSFSPTKIYRF